jgi:hypothetical protein
MSIKPSRYALGGERQRIVQLQPLCTVGMGVDRPQVAGGRMGVVVQAGGVLRRQHHRLLGDACSGGLKVGLEQGL